MIFVCDSHVLICHSNVLISHSYVTCMYLYVTRVSLACTCMSSVCHSYILVCHSYVLLCHQHVTRMYFYVTHISLVYACMSSICHLWRSYVLVYHSTYSYAICMSLECGFTMNQIKQNQARKCFVLTSLELIHIRSSTLQVCPNISEVKPVNNWLAYGIILFRKKLI